MEKISAWVLFFVILAYAITGFGMTKGIIDREIAKSMHLGWLGALLLSWHLLSIQDTLFLWL
jgi:hypothetical protein